MNRPPFRLAFTGQALIEQPVVAASPAAQKLAAELSSAHVAMANFEATLDAAHAWPVKLKTLHVSSPEALASLRKLGLNALGLANNHAFDLGQPGVTATRAGAAAAGFAVTGSGGDLAAATAPAIVMAGNSRIALFAFDAGPQPDMVYAGEHRPGINPLRIRKKLVLPPDEFRQLANIARATGHDERMARRIRVGYSDSGAEGSMDFYGVEISEGVTVTEHRYPDATDLTRARIAIQAAANNTELVIASLHYHHWEVDWTATPEWLQSLCASLVDAGADVVFCHGPPVLQGMGFHRGKPVFYGLGNFIFHTHRAPRYDRNGIDVWHSAIATLHIGENRAVESVSIHPIRVGLPTDKSPDASAYQAPELLSGTEFSRIRDGFLARSEMDGASVSTHESGFSIHAPSPG